MNHPKSAKDQDLKQNNIINKVLNRYIRNGSYLLVDAANIAATKFEQAGGGIVVPPFDIQIGHCVIVRDPWGHLLALLDTSKGLLITDEQGNVIGNQPVD